jgi:hypothetical protein
MQKAKAGVDPFDLKQIPNIGHEFVRYLRMIDVEKPSDLKKKHPFSFTKNCAT